jgi:hypothetical protein
VSVLASSTAIILAQALGIAYVAGLSLYGTIAVLGVMVRIGTGAPLPGGLGAWTNGWVLAIALGLYAIEFATTLTRGLAPAWETIHSLVRPPAAAILAATITWHHDPTLIVLASLLAGALAVVTHTTKLGVRYICATAIPVGWNAAENVFELVVVGAITILIWSHPYSTLGVAMALLVVVIARVQLIWRTLWQVFTGRWKPTSEFLQEPRLQSHRPGLPDE